MKTETSIQATYKSQSIHKRYGLRWGVLLALPALFVAAEVWAEGNTASSAEQPVNDTAAVFGQTPDPDALLLAQSSTTPVAGAAAVEPEASETLEEVTVTGSQIRGAAINDALSVSVITAEDIEAFGISSGDELLDAMPEQGQNFFNEASSISGGVNSARGDVGAFNLRNIGTGNTLVLMNGRRVVNAATYQTEEVGGSFVPVNSANSAAIPVFGIQRVEVLRDGASAIYGADAVAGVVNTVMRNDYDGFAISGRYESFDNIPRDDETVTIEWGSLFNEGKTHVGIFANYYSRDRVNSQDDPKWANSDFRRLIPEGSPWFGSTAFRNDSANSNWGQFDIVRNLRGDPYGLIARGLVDSAGEFETYPVDDPRCAGGFIIAQNTCGNRDGQGTYRYNLNANRDIASDLKRYNVYAYLNHDFDNGVSAYTEFSWYQSDTNLLRHGTASFSSVKLRVGAANYYNPFGPCGSPNRLSAEIIGDLVPCEGLELEIDNYRLAEVPRVVDTKGDVIRVLQGFQGTFATSWDWDTAILYSRATSDDVTHNRPANSLLQEALLDPTAAAYNPFGGGVNTNIERTLVDVYRSNETDLKLVDFKLSNGDLFDIWGGSVGFLAGIEYREESFDDDRDPRLDGTIQFIDWEGDTYPFVSDLVNSSPTDDSSGSRDVTSLFTELAVPLHETLDVQLAMRYENFSDVGSTTVPKIAFGWSPLNWLMLRGSYSEAFRAPNLVTVNESLVVRANTRDDWACIYAADNGGDPGQDILDCTNTIQRRATGSKDLKPEKSENSSLGIVLQPMDGLMLTLDFWRIDKEDTIGLFGEENHTLLDLLERLEAGTASCTGVGNPAVGRGAASDDAAAIYLAAGICPAGDIDFIDDNYANLNTRIVEGYDFGVYYDIATGIGDFGLTWVGTVYTRYDQEPGGRAQRLVNAQDAGTLPSNYPITGFDDLLRKDGNQETKMNARVRWDKADWGASLVWFYLSDFYDSALTLEDGRQFVIPSFDYFNASLDYNFEIFNSSSRVRFGINNVTNERAPLADDFFGFSSDAHRDYGRSYYVDLRMRF